MAFGRGARGRASAAAAAAQFEARLARFAATQSRGRARGTAAHDDDALPEVESQQAIARTAWGAAWCRNLEAYGDFASRLPRGRSYLRSRRVLRLEIDGGTITASVVGTDVYDVTVRIAPIAPAQWAALCGASAGTITSIVSLLQGEVPAMVMTRLCRQDDGLFPRPDEIRFACSCPDMAALCKHVAAVLYGVGALLDTRPALLFTLRGVEAGGLLTGAATAMPLGAAGEPPANALAGVDLSALFGVAIAKAGEAGDGAVAPSSGDAKRGGGRTRRAR
ncbi:MAG: hypothetical protein MUF21_09715 [Gemmatimonadaceae bacterium]|jgi:hypothetical protein|nr:hypothetical protein [Gemmatimonadaceae bacterium]